MEQQVLGRTGRAVSVVGLGAWQVGGDWGQVDEDDALTTLTAAVDAGVTFVDTADVYGDGQRAFGGAPPARASRRRGVRRYQDGPTRRPGHVASAYDADAFRRWTDRSREYLDINTLDLVQLHCPPAAVYTSDAVFDALDVLVAEGRCAAYGVSVETVAEALAAIARPNVASVQIVLNVFRQKPLEHVLPAAEAAGVGVIARVPLASGLLSGKYDETTTFADDDPRSYNRHGEAFDVGETFAGVDYATGVAAAREVAALTPTGATTAQLALRWIIDQPGVTTVIPGARRPEQARSATRRPAVSRRWTPIPVPGCEP